MQPKILFIHPRRGLFQITQCNTCGHVLDCRNCDAHLVTYKVWPENMELVCHQCQTYYNLPKKCPECQSNNLKLSSPGIDELENQILEIFPEASICRLDKKKDQNHTIALTTRLWDPGINYELYSKIIIINAHNVLASPDYLVREDTVKSLTELLNRTDKSQELILDTRIEDDIFASLRTVKSSSELYVWYQSFLDDEAKSRELFSFPPYCNIILLTIQTKNREKSWQQAKELYDQLNRQCHSKHPQVSLTYPYPARFLRRKGMYSYHVLLKYPKRYSTFFDLKDVIQSLADPYSVQIRLNPKHLF